MVSTEGLVPITRAFLASYYDKYDLAPLSADISILTDQLNTMSTDLLNHSPPDQGENLLVQEAQRDPPHKVDENFWKNREQIEEILFLLDAPHWPTCLQQQTMAEDAQLAPVLARLQDKFKVTLKTLEHFQSRNSDFIFNTVMTYMPQDFRGTIIRQQRERSERNKQVALDGLISSGGSIRDKYALLWNHQMERRRQLAELGSATGVYKALMKYLVGVPEVLLEFIRQINDDQGYTLTFMNILLNYYRPKPMEEQRQRYGPPLYSLTRMAYNIRLFLSLLWGRLQTKKLSEHQISVLEEAVDVYTAEFERFLTFIGEVFKNSPFFITADDAGTLEDRSNDEYKEISIPAGQTHEEVDLIGVQEKGDALVRLNSVSLMAESTNSYIAWDFSLVQGKMNVQDIGFSVECTDRCGEKMMILPYRRYGSDQGNFCTCISGEYKLVWDNSYSTFFKKVLRYKVDCIPPVVEPVTSTGE